MISNSYKFLANDKTIEQVLFSTYHKYQVPRYQRPYAWEIDQVSDFVNDLINSEEPFFMGSLIFNTEHAGDKSYIEIIDGQQRLITITILIAVLRDILKDLDKDISQRYQRQDIAVEDRKGKHKYRLMCGESLQRFFESNIQNADANALSSSPETKEEERVLCNYKYIHETVYDLIKIKENKEDKIKIIDNIRDKIAKTIVINIEIGSEESAYEIFETTNARGVDLSISDLVKNLIFKNIRETDERDFAKEVWQEILDNVESTNTDLKKFLRYFWISKYSFVPEKRIFREVKKHISDWTKLLTDLWDASVIYNKMLDGAEDQWIDEPDGRKIFPSLVALRIMNVSQCYVLFMSILRNKSKMGMSPKRIFKIIENFTFKYSVICKLPTNRVEKIYSKYALALEKIFIENSEKQIPSEIHRLFSKLENELRDELPSVEYFTKKFVEIKYANNEKSRMMIKYILKMANDHLRETDEETIDFGSVNIEHILPQRPDKEWWLTKQDIKEYVNNLGNLTLLSKKLNSKVANKIISKKIAEYKISTLSITKDLVKRIEINEMKWDKDSIDTRCQDLSKLAYNTIWKI